MYSVSQYMDGDWVAIIGNWRRGRMASSSVCACSFIVYSWLMVERLE